MHGISRCPRNDAYIKECNCDVLLNTATSVIHVLHLKGMSYPFGSIYYTKLGKIITDHYPTTPLILNDRAVHLLENVMRTNNFWYKPSNLMKNVIHLDEMIAL